MSYADRLEGLAAQDARILREKDKEYGGSWLKRGGVGAFMMLARKVDRIEQAVDPTKVPGDQREAPISASCGKSVAAYDIIEAAIADGREEGILDDIGDLRRYLLLVEAEVRDRLANPQDLDEE